MLDPWVGKIRWRSKWLPTSVFMPGEFHGQRSLVGYSPRGHKELDMMEQLTHWLQSSIFERRLYEWISSVQFSRSVVSDSLRPHGLQPTTFHHLWDFPGKNTGVGCHFLFQEIFPTQGLNPGLPHCRQTLYPLSHQRSPRPQGELTTDFEVTVYVILSSLGFKFQLLQLPQTSTSPLQCSKTATFYLESIPLCLQE